MVNLQYGNSDIAIMERIHKALPKLTTDELITIMNCINNTCISSTIWKPEIAYYNNANSNITSPRDL